LKYSHAGIWVMWSPVNTSPRYSVKTRSHHHPVPQRDERKTSHACMHGAAQWRHGALLMYANVC